MGHGHFKLGGAPNLTTKPLNKHPKHAVPNRKLRALSPEPLNRSVFLSAGTERMDTEPTDDVVDQNTCPNMAEEKP